MRIFIEIIIAIIISLTNPLSISFDESIEQNLIENYCLIIKNQDKQDNVIKRCFNELYIKVSNLEQQSENEIVNNVEGYVNDLSEYFLGNCPFVTGEGMQAAVDAGGIVEVYEGYFASHDYSEGGTFLTFESGDIVHINEYDVTIEGCIYASSGETYEYIRSIIGWDKVCFQTCVSDGEIVIYYGSSPGVSFNPTEYYVEVYENGGASESVSEDTSDDEYNAMIAQLQAEKAALDAEAQEAGAEWVAALESGDEERIKRASDRYDAIQARIMDYNSRVEALY